MSNQKTYRGLEQAELVTVDATTTADSVELLGTEVGNIVRRLVSLFALPVATDPPSRLLTAEEVANLLNTNTQVVYRLARTRELPVVNLGQRMLRFTETSVSQFVKRGGVSRAA